MEHHYSGVVLMAFFKKKKKVDVPGLPPPPSPPGLERPPGDIAPIKPPSLDLGPPGEVAPELPELPAAPAFAHEEEAPAELPEAPSPEMPEVPMPSPEERATPEEISAAPSFEPVEEAPEFPEREVLRKPVGPAFVSVDEYRSIIDNSNRVRAKLTEAEQYLHRLEEIKSEEEKLFEKWRSQLEDVERRLGHIDRVISKAKR